MDKIKDFYAVMTRRVRRGKPIGEWIPHPLASPCELDEALYPLKKYRGEELAWFRVKVLERISAS